jgi:hypothetical protein
MSSSRSDMKPITRKEGVMMDLLNSIWVLKDEYGA